MKKIIVIGLFGVAYFLLSCSPLLYIPQSVNAEEQEKLLSGRKLYVKHCSSCHNLYLPQYFPAEKWKMNLNEMQERAKISELEKQLILQYLTSHP